jgi:cytochrome P450
MHPSGHFAWLAGETTRSGEPGRHRQRRQAIGTVSLSERRLTSIFLEVLKEHVRAGNGELDLAKVTYAFAMAVAAELIGVTRPEAEALLARVDVYTVRPFDAHLNDPDPVLDNLLRQILRAHELDSETLLSEVLASTELTREEIEAIPWGLVGAGVRTAGAAMAGLPMLQEAGLQSAVRDWVGVGNRPAINAAIEGMLAWMPTFPTIPMYGAATCKLENFSVEPGTPVLICVAAANRGLMQMRAGHEPTLLEVLSNSDYSRGHLSFGDPRDTPDPLNSHFCAGAPLARQELGVALRALYGIMPPWMCDLDRFGPRAAGLTPDVMCAPILYDQAAADRILELV